MMADAGSLNLSAFPVFPKMGPLIRTDYGRAPSERPDFIDPSQQWGARSPTKTAGSAPQPVAPTFLSPEQQGFYNYSRLSPQSQNVVSSVQQSAPTGIAGGAMGGLPDYTRQFPSQIEREPMAPVTAGLGGITARRGVRTAYGMVYPAAGQEAAAQRLAQAGPMSARLASVGEKIVRPEVLKSRIDYVKNSPTSDDGSTMRNALEGLTQAEKIRVMRERGKQLARQSRLESQEEFNLAYDRRAQERKEKERERVLAESERSNMLDARRAERVRRRQERSGRTTEEA